MNHLGDNLAVVDCSGTETQLTTPSIHPLSQHPEDVNSRPFSAKNRYVRERQDEAMQNDRRSISNTLIADWLPAGMRPSRTPS